MSDWLFHYWILQNSEKFSEPSYVVRQDSLTGERLAEINTWIEQFKQSSIDSDVLRWRYKANDIAEAKAVTRDLLGVGKQLAKADLTYELTSTQDSIILKVYAVKDRQTASLHGDVQHA